MCILFIYTNPSPQNGKYQLIIATNRDEYYERPAQIAHRWAEDDLVIGGIDLEPGREGGTWFGVSLRPIKDVTFRAAALLNVTGETKPPNAQGRGSIVTDYLRGDLIATEYVERLKEKPYAAFSFVAIELSNSLPRVTYHTNVTPETFTTSPLSPYVHGFGNSLPHEPLLKVLNGSALFLQIISGLPNPLSASLKGLDLTDSLLAALRWRHAHLPDPVLARRAPHAVDQLSRLYVHVPQVGYGTRTHTIVTVDWENRVEVTESTLVGKEWVRTEFHAKI